MIGQSCYIVHVYVNNKICVDISKDLIYNYDVAMMQHKRYDAIDARINNMKRRHDEIEKNDAT